MYFNGTKCRLFMLGCLVSASAVAKDLKTLQSEGIRKPLCFVENKGQVLDENNHSRTDIGFKLSGRGVNLYVGSGHMHYQFRSVKALKDAPQITSYNMDVTLVGANHTAKVEAYDKLGYYENYYLSQAGLNGITASAYSKIVYKNVYNNIDWVLYLHNDAVEYDFVVHPGGNPADIKIEYTGATALKTAKDGSIVASTPMGDVKENKLYAYETSTHKRVAARYVVHDNVVSFETAPYKGTLTIDPYLTWSTYYGGSGEDVVTAVKVSAGANIYATGYTASTNLPVSSTFGNTLYQNTFGGSYDAFLVKYNSAGAIQFSTYFGGAGTDAANGLALDYAGTGIYIGGTTTSTGTTFAVPLATAYQNFNAGGRDMFLTKFNNTGALQWSTYLGGTGDEQGMTIACDSLTTSNVYIAGNTQSADMASTDGSLLQGSSDGYIAKFSTTGVNVWAGYFGGSGDDEINAMAVNNNTFMAITGYTSSADIATAGANQGTPGSASDGFLSYIKTNGLAPSVQWTTYIGGSANDAGAGVISDYQHNIYVAGTTASSDAIASGLGYTSTFSGVNDGFLMKFNSAGVKSWGAYFGGTADEKLNGVATDQFGNIVIAGSTASAGIASTGAYQTTLSGTTDAFVAKYNYLGQKIYSTYFGRTGTDYANAIATDPGITAANASAVVIGGFTNSGTAINTTGAAQSTFGGGISDGFVTKFGRDTIVTIKQPFVDTLLCPGTVFTIRDTVNFNFAAGNNFRVQLSDASGSFAAPVVIGTAVSTTNGAITCTIPVGTTPGAGYRIRIVATNPAFTGVDNNINIAVVSSVPAPNISANSPVCVGLPINFSSSAPYAVTGYSWTGPSSYTSTLQNPTIPAATAANGGTYTVSVTHINNCPPSTNTVTVLVNSFIPPTPTDSTNAPICGGTTLMLFANSGYPGVFSWYWSGPGGFTSTAQNPVIPAVSPADTGYYYVIDTLDGCPSARDSVHVTLYPVDSPNINITVAPNDTVCAGTTLHFSSIVTNAGFSPQFQWMRNTSPIVGAIFSSYSSATLTNYDIIWCRLQGSVQCPDKPYDTSNQVMVSILDNTPVATITAIPDTFIAPGSTVTLTAAYAGVSIVGYNWYVNNVLVASATTPTLVLTGITSNDTVRFEVLSNALCANLGVSNTIVLHVTTAVANVSNEFRNVDLFPNPNNGTFTVKGQLDGIADGDATVEIANALGQTVYSGAASVVNGMLNSSVQVRDIPGGVYMLRINKDGAGKVFRFVKD